MMDTMIGKILLALSFFAFNLPAFSAPTDLNVSSVHISSTSLRCSWINTGAPWIVALSTDDFTSTVSSGSVASNSTNYLNLTPDTTYFFRVKIATETDASYSFGVNQLSTVTWAAAPQNLSVEYSYAFSENNAELRLNFPNINPSWTRYKIRYSSGVANYSYIQGAPPLGLAGLLANTTYSIDVLAINSLGRETSYSSVLTTATMAVFSPLITHSVYETSATVIWTTLPPSPQESTAEGYKIILSTNANFEAAIEIWSDTDISKSSRTFTSLNRNTTYYYKMGTLNWNNELNPTLKEFTTLTNKPSSFQLISISSTHARLGWTAFPSWPSSSSAMGYRLEASTSTSFSSYVSSSSFNIFPSTLTVGVLDSNTTYYFRVGALNQRGDPNYSQRTTTVTLSLPLSSNEISYSPSTMSIQAAYYPLPPAPPNPESLSSKGYVFQVSTNPFTTGPVYSSTTYENDNGSLRIENLRPNTDYYMRLGTLNHALAPNYSPVTMKRTAMPDPTTGVVISEMGDVFATISYTTVPSDGYSIDASLDEFRNVSQTSSTLLSDLASLTVFGLTPNTGYYFRHASIFNGAPAYIGASPYYMYTFTNKVTGQALQNVYISSAALSWNTVSCNGYQVEASTRSNFTGTVYASTTYDSSSAGLTVSALTPNTSYYFRTGSINLENNKNYAVYFVTSTLANFPLQTLPFTTADLSTGSVKVNWSRNSNPTDTLYVIEVSSNPGFSAPLHSSSTKNNFAVFGDLNSNTTYYQRITTYNRLNRTAGIVNFSPVAALAYDPDPAPFTGLGRSTVTLNWGPGGSNPFPGTLFLAEISSTNFNDSIISSVTLNASAAFYGLLSNTSYYLRVSALNYSDIPSNYVSLSTALTEPQAPAAFSAENTFSNLMIDGFTASWSENYNSTATVYSLWASTDGLFNMFNSSVSTLNASFTFSALQTGTTYHVRIMATGQTGLTTDWVALGSTCTVSSTKRTVDSDETTVISLPYSYGNIEIYIGANFLGGATRISLYPETSFPAANSNAGVLRPTNIGIMIENFPPTVFNSPVRITIPYRLSDIPAGLDPQKFVIATYSEAAGLWAPLSSVSDTANRRVTGQTYHFSLFQIMELTPGDDLSNIKIYPNPYKPNSHSGLMNFSNMPKGTQIRIFTATGELVKKFTVSDYGMAHWDAKNESNRKVASGVYIAIFKSPSGDKKMKKVAIER